MIHETLPLLRGTDEVHRVCGDYDYYHYGCDGLDDRGWGCGYRTLQTLCSWVGNQKLYTNTTTQHVPGLRDIQNALVAMGDKPASFKESREWIGSVEVAICIDYFYDVPCKILHVSSGKEMVTIGDELICHFKDKGSPVMMGGDSDSSSKGIMGVAKSGTSCHLLILDPHYYGLQPSGACLQEQGMLLWRPLDSFMADSFYNLCLPQLSVAQRER